MLLSICMMIKNEEKKLDECLASLKPLREALSSELIIIDTGSTDSSVEIAKKYTDKLYFEKWNNNFSEMRNKTISYAKGEWIFIFDGDEVLEDTSNIIKFLKSEESKRYNSATLIGKNITTRNEEKVAVNVGLRFFRNDGSFRYDGAVHNVPVYKEPTFDIDAAYRHYGYVSDDLELMEKKFKRTAILLKNELEKDPNNIYYWFQLSVSYQMHNESKEAVKYAEKAYNLMQESDFFKINNMYVYSDLASLYFGEKRYKECKKICEEGIEQKDEYIDLHYYLAVSNDILGNSEEAIGNYNDYLNMVDKYYNGAKDINRSFVSYTLGKKDVVYLKLMNLYSTKKDYLNAIKIFDSIEDKILKIDSIKYLVAPLLYSNKINKLKSYLNNYKDEEVMYNEFINSIEAFVNNCENNEEILQTLTSLQGEYGLLSKVRLLLNKGEFNESILKEIEEIDFYKGFSFFGDFIWYFIKNNIRIADVIKIREDKLSGYLQYICSKYEDSIEELLNYLDSIVIREANDLKDIKTILRVILIKGEIKEDIYKEKFLEYIDLGIEYMKLLYNESLLEEENISLLRNDEEIFLVYMNYAFSYKGIDDKKYLQYLRRALLSYDYMKRGIEILKNEFEESFNSNNNELKILKDKFIMNVKAIAEVGDYCNAITMIEEMESIFPEDIDILMLNLQIRRLSINKA